MAVKVGVAFCGSGFICGFAETAAVAVAVVVVVVVAVIVLAFVFPVSPYDEEDEE